MTHLDPATADRLERFVYDVMATESLPGVSVAVVDADRLTYANGFGSRDLGENRAATAETLYGFGSVTKSFTALAVMQLAEAGHLDVRDPVSDHVPFEVETDEPVTLHHLLTHSSGLPSLGVSEALIARRTGSGEAGVPLGDRDDVHAHLAGAGDELLGPPGEHFAYCNTGYILLGEVIERYAPGDYVSYVTDSILEPLGMARSTFDGDRFAADPDRLTPYFHDGGDPTPATFPERPVTYPTGGLVAPVTEVATYLRLQLGGGAVDDTRLVSAAAVERMHEGHVETPEGPYGYGWRRRDVAGTTVVGHGGSIGVSSAYVGIAPGDGFGVAVASNTSPPAGLAQLGQGVAAVVAGADPEVLPYFDRRARYDAYVGEYETYRGILSATVSRDGQFLRLDVDGTRGSAGTPLVPVEGSPGAFYEVTPGGERAPVRFVRDDDGVHLRYDRRHFHRVG